MQTPKFGRSACSDWGKTKKGIPPNLIVSIVAFDHQYLLMFSWPRRWKLTRWRDLTFLVPPRKEIEKRGENAPPPHSNQPGIIRLGRSRSIKDTKRGSCMAYVFRGQWVFLLASCLSFETGLGISKHMCAKALIFSPTRKQQHPQLERKKRIKLISRSKFAGGGKSSEQNFSILWLCKLLRFSGLRIESTQFEYHSHCCCGKLGANFGVAWQSSLSFQFGGKRLFFFFWWWEYILKWWLLFGCQPAIEVISVLTNIILFLSFQVGCYWILFRYADGWTGICRQTWLNLFGGCDGQI